MKIDRGLIANVVHGEGFTASVIRSVLTAMTLLSGGPPRRTFSEVRPAMDWLATRMAVTPADLAPVTQWSERTLRELTDIGAGPVPSAQTA